MNVDILRSETFNNLHLSASRKLEAGFLCPLSKKLRKLIFPGERTYRDTKLKVLQQNSWAITNHSIFKLNCSQGIPININFQVAFLLSVLNMSTAKTKPIRKKKKLKRANRTEKKKTSEF